MQYLQDEQHYIDRYDLDTIEECLDTVKMFQEVYQKSLVSEEMKHLSQEEKARNVNIMLSRALFFIQAKWYQSKQETIRKWMDDDKRKQDKQDFTPEPTGVVCPLCGASMNFNVTKQLEYSYDSPIMRMMFLLKCSKCAKQQWVYDDGEIRVFKPNLCPKCKEEMEVSASRKGKVVTWKYTCKACGYTKIETEDLAEKDKEMEKWKEHRKREEEENKKLLEKYRKEYCLSDTEGKKYVEEMEALEVGHEVYEEEKRKYDRQAYQASVSLKKLTILDLEKLLAEKLLKENYVKFTLDKPDMGRFVVVPFSVLDATSTRRQYKRGYAQETY